MVGDDEQGSGRAGGFDPRYDPAFQRGYRPTPGERSRTRIRPVPPMETEPPTGERSPRAGRTPAAWELGDEDEETPPPAEAASLSIAPLPSAIDGPAEAASAASPAVVVAAPGVLDRIELSPRRNPLMLALWVVGAGLVVVGIVLYCISVTVSYAGPTPNSDVGSLVFAQLGWMLAGPLITVGLVTLVALLFLTALAGRRPAPDRGEEG